MFFTAKSRGFFVDLNEYSTVIASTSSFESPIVVEAVRVLPPGSYAAVGEALCEIAGVNRKSGYQHAVCGIYPARQLIRRANVDLKRMKDSGSVEYLEEMLTAQFRAEPSKMMLAVLSAVDGQEVDLTKPAAKEVLFCGSYAEDFTQIQSALLEAGVYPERLELGSVAMLGLAVDLMAQQDGKSPTLVLELGREVTNCYIVNAGGVDLARPIPHGVNSMIPVVHKELGLKDEEAAAKLLFSNTFDFTGMGSTLVKRLLKELQSSIGFYEVQTGQSIGRLLCTVLPANHAWVANTLSESLGIAPFKVDFDPWLQKQGIRIAEGVAWEKLGSSRFGLLSLMSQPQAAAKNHEGK